MSVDCRELFKVHRTPEGDAAALQGLTMHADPGEMLAVLGPSGSGKSTLLRILAGLERPSAGSAVVDGFDMARLPARRRQDVRRRRIGFLGQHFEMALSPALSVGESLTVPLGLRGLSRSRARREASALLSTVGLPAAVMRARPEELSGGERQRAAVCVALGHHPSVLLADEPTGELDAAAATDVLRVLRGLADEREVSVVLVTHDPIGAATAHRVIRIRDGKVSSEGMDDQRVVVVGHGGWLHLPAELLSSAGIADRALASAQDGKVVLEPAASRGPGPSGAPSQPQRPTLGPGRAEPIDVRLLGVTKRYARRTVFEGFSAELEPGSLTAVTGRSGSGKSTLLRLLGGLERPEAGSLWVAGSPLHGQSREALADLRRRHIAVVAQDVRLAPFLSAAEQVALPLVLTGVSAGDAQAQADTWLIAVGLADRARQRVGRLSAGEQQRVAIARALAGGRGLMLVDEPTSRLDEANAIAISTLLRQMSDDHGITVVCATHDPIVAERAHRIIALDGPAPTGDRKFRG